MERHEEYMKRRIREEEEEKESKTETIILLSDVIESKIRKEQELEYYQKELEKLVEKMGWIRKEIDVTNIIIDIISNETVLEIPGTKQARLVNSFSKK